MSDLVEIIAVAIENSEGLGRNWTVYGAHMVLAAMEEAGYQVVKKRPGVSHEQVPYEVEKKEN